MRKLFVLLAICLFFFSCTSDIESDRLKEIEKRLETLDTDTPVEHDRTSDILTLPS